MTLVSAIPWLRGGKGLPGGPERCLQPSGASFVFQLSWKVVFWRGLLSRASLKALTELTVEELVAVAGIPADRYETIDSWARHTIELARMGSELFYSST